MVSYIRLCPSPNESLQHRASVWCSVSLSKGYRGCIRVVTVEVVSSQWKAKQPPFQCTVMSLLNNTIPLSSALFPPSVSANLSSFTSFSAFLLLSSPLPYSHRGPLWVINSWHSLGSSSQLQWGCASSYAPTNVSWQTAEGMKYNTAVGKKKITKKADSVPSKQLVPWSRIREAARWSTCPLNGRLFPIKWHNGGLQLAHTPGPAGG